MNTQQTTTIRSLLATPADLPLVLAAVVGFTLLTAVGSLIAIPLPFTPVPITLQTLFVTLAGVTLGSRLGLVSMAFYLLLGSVGYQVFAGGEWGLLTIFGATGGYLLGFVVAQPVMGRVLRRRVRTWHALLLAVLAGHAVILACGAGWLALWLQVGPVQALALGVLPFLPGCALKTAIAVGVGRLVAPATRAVFAPER